MVCHRRRDCFLRTALQATQRRQNSDPTGSIQKNAVLEYAERKSRCGQRMRNPEQPASMNAFFVDQFDRRARRPAPMGPDGKPLPGRRPGGIGVASSPINPNGNANPAAAARARAALQKTRIEATKVPKAVGGKEE